jgi:hypothetical protein
MVQAGRVTPLRAEVAELADAQASGACGRKVVKVQILSSAPTKFFYENDFSSTTELISRMSPPGAGAEPRIPAAELHYRRLGLVRVRRVC